MRWGAKSVGHICCFLDQSKILVAQTEIDRYVREVGFWEVMARMHRRQTERQPDGFDLQSLEFPQRNSA